LGIILNYMSKSFLLILLTALHFAVAAKAGEPLYRHFPPINAYSAGMGFAGGVVWEDPSVVFWNPAGLALLDQMSAEVTLAGPKAAMPSSWSILVANSAAAGESRFGFGFLRRHSLDDIGEYCSFQVVMPLSYGFGSGKLPFGVTMKFASERYDDRDDWTYGVLFDVGLLWRIADGFAIGASRLNIVGSALSSFQPESWLSAEIGAETSPVIIAAQTRFDAPSDKAFMQANYSLGARLDFGRKAPGLRGGYLKREGITWFAGGFGWINLDANTSIEYSLLVQADDQTNRAHFLTYGYSLKPRTKKPTAGTYTF